MKLALYSIFCFSLQFLWSGTKESVCPVNFVADLKNDMCFTLLPQQTMVIYYERVCLDDATNENEKWNDSYPLIVATYLTMVIKGEFKFVQSVHIALSKVNNKVYIFNGSSDSVFGEPFASNMRTVDLFVCYKSLDKTIMKTCTSYNPKVESSDPNISCEFDHNSRRCVEKWLRNNTNDRTRPEDTCFYKGLDAELKFPCTTCSLDDCANSSIVSSDCSPDVCGKNRKKIVNSAEYYGDQELGVCAVDTNLTEINCPDVECFDYTACNYTEWENWSNCTANCGRGTKTRNRTVENDGQEGCAYPPDETIDISHCWDYTNCTCQIYVEAWGECKSDKPEVALCGGRGKQSRLVKMIPLEGQEGCDDEWTEDRTCPNEPCPEDCVYDEWSAWSDCSTTCGVGTKHRTRTYEKEAKYGGKNCSKHSYKETEAGGTNETGNYSQSESFEVRSCYGVQQMCPIHCEWGSWRVVCDKPCYEDGSNLDFTGRKIREEAVSRSLYGNECVGPKEMNETCKKDEDIFACNYTKPAPQQSSFEDIVNDDQYFMYIVLSLVGFVIFVAVVAGICIYRARKRRHRRSKMDIPLRPIKKPQGGEVSPSKMQSKKKS